MKILSIIALMLVAGCGLFEPAEYPEQDPPVVEVIIEDPDDDPTPPGQATPYWRAQEILDRRCSSCHQGDDFMLSEGQLRDSRAFDKVQRSEMPPGAPLQGAERTDFLSFFFEIASLTAIE